MIVVLPLQSLIHTPRNLLATSLQEKASRWVCLYLHCVQSSLLNWRVKRAGGGGNTCPSISKLGADFLWEAICQLGSGAVSIDQLHLQFSSQTTDPWSCRVTVGEYWDLWKLWDPIMDPLLFQTVWGTPCSILLSLAAGSDREPELAGKRAVGGRQAFSCSQGIVFHLGDVQCKGLLIKASPIPVPNLKLSPNGNAEPYFYCFKVKNEGG